MGSDGDYSNKNNTQENFKSKLAFTCTLVSKLLLTCLGPHSQSLCPKGA